MRSILLRASAAIAFAGLLATPAAALSGGSPAPAGDRLTRATVFITSLTPTARNRAQVANCTGVLIERDLVLTAGHCLADLGGPSVVVAQFFDRSNRIAETIEVAAGAMHPDFAGRGDAENPRPDLLGADLAILKLATLAPKGRRPIALAKRPVEASKLKSILAGAGLRTPADEASAGQLRFARVNAEVVTDGPTAVALGTTGGAVCRGDSGGPVISSGGLWGVVIAIVRRKNLCNSTIFMAVVDPESRGFRNMLARARRG
ncbi:S1 family peptidase [Methylopila sp. 73B]|uniref:S1 family peptidase n=1 Tax=Methylopila sp. 73B TaxID=1120792 RepID=UPI00037446B5|nr:S1 family peptidase [Methylopila sp. 73B]